MHGIINAGVFYGLPGECRFFMSRVLAPADDSTIPKPQLLEIAVDDREDEKDHASWVSSNIGC